MQSIRLRSRSTGETADRSTYSLPAGATSFSVTHQYLDDNPSGTASDIYPIAVTVTDNHGAGDSDSTSVRVDNVAPTWERLPAGHAARSRCR